MTTTNDPDVIRAEIDRTRGRLSEDVDVLTESVRPSSVAKRTAQRATGRASRLKETVMGSAHDAGDHGSDLAHGAADTVKDVPDMARRQARGNPLAAGAVALAAGWLVGSLLPASEKERQLAGTAKEQAQPLVEEAKSVAQDTAQHLKEPAQRAADSLKETAREGVEHVKDDGSTAVRDVKETAGEAARGGVSGTSTSSI
jgi:type VI protein secretion system component VasK